MTSNQDPGYFAAYLLQHFHHREEHVEGISGRTYLDMTSKQRDNVWAAIIVEMVEAPMRELIHYEHLLAFTVKLQELHPKVDPQVEAEGWQTVTNFEYIENLSCFETRLVDLWFDLSGDLINHFMASTPGRVVSLRRKNGKLVPSFSDNDESLTKRLLVLTMGTTREDNGRVDTEALDCLDHLERLVQRDKSAKVLVTPLVAHTIGKLSVVREALRHTYANQPWYRASEYMGVYDPAPAQLFGGKDQRCKDYGLYHTSLKDDAEKKRLGFESARPDLDPDKFDYPIDGQWTAQNLMHIQAAELAVDVFWNSFDKYWDAFNLEHQVKHPTASFRTPARDRAVMIMKGWRGLLRYGNWANFEERKTAKDVVECGLKLQVRTKSGHLASRRGLLFFDSSPTASVQGSQRSSTSLAKADIQVGASSNSRPPWSDLRRRRTSSQGLPRHVLAPDRKGTAP